MKKELVKKDRPLLIAGNWKMNLGIRETHEFATSLKKLFAQHPEIRLGENLQALIFPSTITLPTATPLFQSLGVQVGAQNIHWKDKGAYTGETSIPMIQELGIQWTLVGHSERRQFFGETDQTVKMRSTTHLQAGLKVMLCIGESRSERENKQTEPRLLSQLQEGLPDIEDPVSKLYIAYEPIWAIGTGLTATPEQAEEAHCIVREGLTQKYGSSASKKISILYGGSVNPENISALMEKSNIDGGLVGGASLQAESYFKLLSSCN